MASMVMSRIMAAAGREPGVGGRKGCRWRQRRTEIKLSSVQRRLQRTGSSIMIRRVVRFRIPYSVALVERYA